MFVAQGPVGPAAPWACQRQVRRVPRARARLKAVRSDGHASVPLHRHPVRRRSVRNRRQRAGRGRRASHRARTVAVTLAGTTQDSQVTVSLLQTHDRTSIKKLAVNRVDVRTGRLGSFQGLTTTDLLVAVSPLQGPVSSLQFDAMGPAARVNVAGNLGQLTVNQGVTLGSSGHIRVASDLTGAVTVAGNIALNGGDVSVGRDATGR